MVGFVRTVLAAGAMRANSPLFSDSAQLSPCLLETQWVLPFWDDRTPIIFCPPGAPAVTPMKYGAMTLSVDGKYF